MRKPRATGLAWFAAAVQIWLVTGRSGWSNRTTQMIRRSGPVTIMEAEHQGYTLEIDEIQETEWSELLRRFEDATFYQTWGYGSMRRNRHLTHLVVKRDNDVLAAIQGEIVQLPGLKIGIAHFPWGPMWRVRGTQMDTGSLRVALQGLFSHYAVDRGLLVRVRTCESQDERTQGTTFPVFRQQGFRPVAKHHYQTVRLDLSNEVAELRRKMCSRWRRHLRAAEKRDFAIVQGDSRELFTEFSRVYREMYSRKTIVGYDPDIDKYGDIQDRLPAHLKFSVMLCKYEGEVVAANVLSAMGDTGMYVFGATSDRAIRENLCASYLLHWQTIEWLREHGYRWYDLRGYDPKLYPGISHFKAGLNGEVVRFAEFVAWRNPVSLATVTLGEGVVTTLHAARNRFRRTKA